MSINETCPKTAKILKERILIFGGSGSLGKVAIERWINTNLVCNVSRDEEKQWNLKNSVCDNKNLSQIIGDISLQEDVDNSILSFDPTIICIFACLKHIELCEKFPKKSISINSNGIMNVHNTLIRNKTNVHTVLFVSTDKACLPITTYGCSKAIAEFFLQTTNQINDTKWVGVRYGNVLNSSGSIIPYLQKNKNSKDPYTLTHEKMTRFIMTLEQSINLIEHAIIFGHHNEIIVPKLVSMRIVDLFEIFENEYNKKRKIIGLRCKEKIHEDLISSVEAENVLIVNDFYYHITTKKQVSSVKLLNSNDVTISKDELYQYLKEQNII